MKTLMPTFAVGALLVAGQAAAEQPARSAQAGSEGRSASERFPAIDRDGDGVIGDQEAAAALERLFKQMDQDDSGSVVPSEYAGFHLPGRTNPDQKPFDQVDLDGDGQIGRSEYLKVGLERFQATNTDGDPGISLSEYRASAL